MKKIIIVFDEKGINMNLEGDMTRTDIIGALSLCSQTLLKDASVQINIIKPEKVKTKKGRSL